MLGEDGGDWVSADKASGVTASMRFCSSASRVASSACWRARKRARLVICCTTALHAESSDEEGLSCLLLEHSQSLSTTALICWFDPLFASFLLCCLNSPPGGGGDSVSLFSSSHFKTWNCVFELVAR